VALDESECFDSSASLLVAMGLGLSIPLFAILLPELSVDFYNVPFKMIYIMKLLNEIPVSHPLSSLVPSSLFLINTST
jgi:hypothetical protein